MTDKTAQLFDLDAVRKQRTAKADKAKGEEFLELFWPDDGPFIRPAYEEPPPEPKK